MQAADGANGVGIAVLIADYFYPANLVSLFLLVVVYRHLILCQGDLAHREKCQCQCSDNLACFQHAFTFYMMHPFRSLNV